LLYRCREKRYGRCISLPKTSTNVYQLSTEGLPELYRGSTKLYRSSTSHFGRRTTVFAHPQFYRVEAAPAYERPTRLLAIFE
jgi:hypothetical protein